MRGDFSPDVMVGKVLLVAELSTFSKGSVVDDVSPRNENMMGVSSQMPWVQLIREIFQLFHTIGVHTVGWIKR